MEHLVVLKNKNIMVDQSYPRPQCSYSYNEFSNKVLYGKWSKQWSDLYQI